MLKYAVVIPAYNEAPRIGDVISTVKKFSSHIIVVDDGSKDWTSEAAQKSGVTVLRHKVNLGKGAAMKTGAEAAFIQGADVVVFLDADGQHNPHHLPKFLKKIEQGNHVVFGSRNFSYGVPLIRFLGNKFVAVTISLTCGIYRSDILCGFFALTKESYDKIKWDSARYGVETEIVARTGRNKLKYDEVEIEAIYIDKYKGMNILDAFSIVSNIPRWILS